MPRRELPKKERDRLYTVKSWDERGRRWRIPYTTADMPLAELKQFGRQRRISKLFGFGKSRKYDAFVRGLKGLDRGRFAEVMTHVLFHSGYFGNNHELAEKYAKTIAETRTLRNRILNGREFREGIMKARPFFKPQTFEETLKRNPWPIVERILPLLGGVPREAEEPPNAQAAAGEEMVGRRVSEEGMPQEAGGGVGGVKIEGGVSGSGSFVGNVFNAPIIQNFNSGISAEHAKKLTRYGMLRKQLVMSAAQNQALREEASALGELSEQLVGRLGEAEKRRQSLGITLKKIGQEAGRARFATLRPVIADALTRMRAARGRGRVAPSDAVTLDSAIRRMSKDPLFANKILMALKPHEIPIVGGVLGLDTREVEGRRKEEIGKLAGVLAQAAARPPELRRKGGRTGAPQNILPWSSPRALDLDRNFSEGALELMKRKKEQKK
ncbi:hypothetical protein COT29_00965 [Candidatus Micrarchaeota archaeon CG08_land_8_20_14_0_20_59_11]|nr:MAG: hypothetical protein COT29_00965 [Candidatus Micrarchaeota archaeon CG08_land_8_20_14_0_20_59_11]